MHRDFLFSYALPLTMQVLELLMQRQNLSEQQTSDSLQALVAGAEPAQMAAFLVLLRAKGETPEEVAGLAKAMRAMGVPVPTKHDGGWAARGAARSRVSTAAVLCNLQGQPRVTRQLGREGARQPLVVGQDLAMRMPAGRCALLAAVLRLLMAKLSMSAATHGCRPL